LYADEPILTQPAAEALKQAFFANLASLLNLTTSSVNVTAEFLAANVSETSPAEDMTTYMAYVYSDQNSVEGWDEIGAPLTELYKSLNNGASPPVDPPVNISWADGQNATTRARFPESQARRVNFETFYNEKILPSDEETCSESIFAHSYHLPPALSKVTPSVTALTIGWYNGVEQSMYSPCPPSFLQSQQYSAAES
jgi:hypothetical protein